MIREQPWYRRSVFTEGLKRAGHEVRIGTPDRLDPSTLLVIWNRYGENHSLALRVEAAGGRVLVAENGYIGKGGSAPKFDVHPHGPKPGDYYALSEGYHNGGGRWFIGGDERWEQLGIEVKPRRRGGDYILICSNRSFGVPGRMMHPDWPERTQEKLSKVCKVPVKLRRHPGNNAPSRPLSADLAGAAAVYVWTSSAGVHALCQGIPVFAEAPYWIMRSACASGLIEDPDSWQVPDPLPALRRLAWAQWTCEEIQSGEPFVRLLS